MIGVVLLSGVLSKNGDPTHFYTDEMASTQRGEYKKNMVLTGLTHVSFPNLDDEEGFARFGLACFRSNAILE